MSRAAGPLALVFALYLAGQVAPPRPERTAAADELLTSAKAAVQEAPSIFAPWIRVNIAEAELRLRSGPPTTETEADFDRAFRGALELRSPRGADDLEGQLLFQIKQGVEWHVVGSLADRDYPRALAFARSADVPKREVYDQLLAAASRGALKNKKDVSFDVIGLILECQSADGSYPYQGMQKILLNPGIDPEMKRQAMGLAFAAAARETRGYELAIAASLLAVAADHVSGLGQPLEDTTPSVLKHIAAAATALGSRGNSEGVFGFQLIQDGVHLLSAVAQYDPDRARELAAQFPQFAAASPQEATVEASTKAAVTRQDLLKSYAPPEPQDNSPEQAKFLAWTERADALAQTEPKEALDDARRALGYASANVLAARRNFLAAHDLAATLAGLKDTASATDLLNREFDVAEANALATSRQLQDAQGDERIKILTKMFDCNDASLLVLTAAKILPSLTVNRVESWRDSATRASLLVTAAIDIENR